LSAHSILEAILLGAVVLACWVGVLGMWRMRQPMQALHYLALPAAVGSVALALAVFVAQGNTQASWKALLIAFVLFAFNSIVAHATARAFRTRELGHWEPREGDSFEFVRDLEPKLETQSGNAMKEAP
jgi:multisubunit Na+/H+ antiporter MnhG subunit